MVCWFVGFVWFGLIGLFGPLLSLVAWGNWVWGIGQRIIGLWGLVNDQAYTAFVSPKWGGQRPFVCDQTKVTSHTPKKDMPCWIYGWSRQAGFLPKTRETS